MRTLTRLIPTFAAIGLGACGGGTGSGPADSPADGPPDGNAQPTAGITLPPGFVATVFADQLPTPRHIAVRDNGDVYVTLRSGQAKIRPTTEPGGVAGLRDSDGDGVADITRTFGRPETDTGLAINAGSIYYSTMTGIYAFPLGPDLLPAGPEETVVEQMPESGSGHRTKPITFDNDGHLYTQIGSPSNACQTEPGVPGSPGLAPCTLLDEHGGVFRFIASSRDRIHASDGIRTATGHRNVVALEWNEAAGALYLLMHGRDGLHELWPAIYSEADDIELPAEEFHRLEQGDDLGWPYTYWDPIRERRIVMPEYGGDGETPAEPGRYKDPLIGFPGHWAPDDLVFYTGTQFPERYRNGAFIAFHGPIRPRRADPGGYSVVFVPMNAAGEITGDWEIFADDFEHAVNPATGAIGRPAGLAVGPDGSLYIVDDSGGRIFEVSYPGDQARRAPAAARP